MITTDLVPIPLREKRGSEWRVLKEPNSIFNIGSPNSTNALEQSTEDSNRKKVISILMETKIKGKKNKRGGRKEMRYRNRRAS